jgi:hypothetical protein
MDMIKRPIFLLLVGAGVAAIAVFLFLLLRVGGGGETVTSSDPRGVEGEAIDVALDFYDAWLSARKSSSTDPYTNGLTSSLALSLDMSKKLIDTETSFKESGQDPVLCQPSIPSGLRTRSIHNDGIEAQFLVLSKDKTAHQAVVTLVAHDGLWEITDITCGAGEQAPDQGEFSFDREGFLLNDLPPPLDSQSWYVVFIEADVPGHTAPLILGPDSSCVLIDGSSQTCSTELFSKAQPVHVQGNLTEAGVGVKHIEFLDHAPY